MTTSFLVPLCSNFILMKVRTNVLYLSSLFTLWCVFFVFVLFFSFGPDMIKLPHTLVSLLYLQPKILPPSFSTPQLSLSTHQTAKFRCFCSTLSCLLKCPVTSYASWQLQERAVSDAKAVHVN